MWPLFSMPLLIVIGIFMLLECRAYSSPEQLTLNRLGQINTYTPLEPAFSKGSIGFTFGLGMQTQVFNDPQFSSWGNPEDYENHRHESLVSAYLVKGIHGPFDFGIVAGQVPGSTVNRIGGHGQWTIYQGFRRPSVATRFAFSRLSGFQGTELASSQATLLADFSFLRYITIFTGLSTQHHQASYQNYIPNWNLTLMQSPEQITKNWWDQHLSLGFNVKLFSPHFNLTTERQSFSTGKVQWLTKLSFGI